ncbi:MAG TPA: agmatinase [Thermoguttaceae bacterium]|nr:agmatinase [Thermoguttaceae bacterium]
MASVHPDQFLGLPPCPPEQADAVVVPLPLEKTVSYGTGTWRAPRAILDASCQVELFDEETLIDFSEFPRVHTAPPVVVDGSLEEYLAAIRDSVAAFRDKFVVALGGEHTVTFGCATGLVDRPAELTVVQIDAHADLMDELDGRRWSHGTVIRRLWEEGCRLIQIGIRSLSRSEYDLATADERIRTYFAHRLGEQWNDLIDTLRQLEGEVYLTIDVDGLDPSVIPTTGTPQPNGLSWRQTMEVLHALTAATRCRLVGADIVEFVASPHPPGCDIIVARLLAKILAWRFADSAAPPYPATQRRR